ncbi:unnamed protein product [Amoebophrya sp. A120]|nr:unnamed protein product [Amoebophrya sp. A120]|eukprot:GSA120T00024112001.1
MQQRSFQICHAVSTFLFVSLFHEVFYNSLRKNYPRFAIQIPTCKMSALSALALKISFCWFLISIFSSCTFVKNTLLALQATCVFILVSCFWFYELDIFRGHWQGAV